MMRVARVGAGFVRVAVLGAGLAGLAAAAVLWQPRSVAAQDAVTPDAPEFYAHNVVPVFHANCYRCHGGMNHRGSLTLDTRAGLLRGGKDGAIIVPGHPEQSLLVQLIRHEGPADDPMPMPPKRKISDADIATVTAWVKAGAHLPADMQ
jgi:cytochrome c